MSLPQGQQGSTGFGSVFQKWNWFLPDRLRFFRIGSVVSQDTVIGFTEQDEGFSDRIGCSKDKKKKLTDIGFLLEILTDIG